MTIALTAAIHTQCGAPLLTDPLMLEEVVLEEVVLEDDVLSDDTTIIYIYIYK